MDYTITLKYYSFLYEAVKEYEEKLNELFANYIATSHDVENSCLYVTISSNIEKQKLQEVLSFMLYITHPFYSIVNDIGEEVFQADFSTRDYFLYFEEQRRQELFHLYVLTYKTLSHFSHELRGSDKLSFIELYSLSATLSIESSKMIQKIPQNVMKRFNVVYSSQQPPLHLPYPSATLFSNKSSNKEGSQGVKINQFHVLTHHQELLKQIKEETSKAHIKIRPSIIEDELLDVKFIANHFTYAFSSLLTPIYLDNMREIIDNYNFNTSQENFDTFIDYFLYQVEFITTCGASLLCEYEIQVAILKKYNLTCVEKIELSHPFDYSKCCFLYIIKKNKQIIH